ncbi:ATP-grasp domain-containing protein [Streptomyces sp. CBMA156]|uniref:ATP-grasp domain-containing protein n=1 Tax=Streptomyces sp. CBMA156 TaxID=1930280 RepID=UPI0016620D4A|nr:ATP-grasp domain-containing protein [Streptomyces sp. CBMA156]MBD0670729.1 ATP-grasp domain protein [Streptomyces sp. CBMA156]
MSAPVRVWLNRTYAENVFFVEQLRAAPRPVVVHATHGDPDSPVLAAADHGTAEPADLPADRYVGYALDYCARHSIDVFVPQLHQLAIALARPEFEAIGTALLCPPATAVAAFTSKADGYAAIAGAGLPTPPWWRVRTPGELWDAVGRIEGGGHTACLKPVAGAGGAGFRVLTRKPYGAHRLAGWDHRVQVDQVAAALDEGGPDGEPVDLLVMPYLDGPEVSVDSLADLDGTPLTAVGRTKDGRRRGFTTEECYLEPVRRLVRSTGMAYLSNVQFRRFDGRPVVIDVNTRPAAGLHQLRLCGLNLPWDAVRLALGERPTGAGAAPDVRGIEYTLVSGIQPVLPSRAPGRVSLVRALHR